MWRFNTEVENKFVLSLVLLPMEITPERIVPKAPQRQLNGWCRTGAQISKGFKLKVCNKQKKKKLFRVERRKMYVSAGTILVCRARPNIFMTYCDFCYVCLHALLLRLVPPWYFHKNTVQLPVFFFFISIFPRG